MNLTPERIAELEKQLERFNPHYDYASVRFADLRDLLALIAEHKRMGEVLEFVCNAAKACEGEGHHQAMLIAAAAHARSALSPTPAEGVKSVESDTDKCASCDHEFPRSQLIYGPNPFKSEIHNDHTPTVLCEACHHELCMDI